MVTSFFFTKPVLPTPCLPFRSLNVFPSIPRIMHWPLITFHIFSPIKISFLSYNHLRPRQGEGNLGLQGFNLMHEAEGAVGGPVGFGDDAWILSNDGRSRTNFQPFCLGLTPVLAPALVNRCCLSLVTKFGLGWCNWTGPFSETCWG
jgi:hypothetical protein